jgi:tetratricopeptide (TPR) repeat protein
LEIWYYDNVNKEGLPASMQLIFFKKGGVGDYKLFSPLFDGANALFANKSIETFALRDNWYLLTEVPLEVQKAMYSIAPGLNEHDSEIYISLLRMPFNTIKKRTGSQKEIAKVESIVYLDNCLFDIFTFYHLNELRVPMLHGAILLPPEIINYQTYNDKIHALLNISVEIMNNKKQVVDYFNDSVPLEFAVKELGKIKELPLLYEFSTVLLDGDYRIQVLIQDAVSQSICRAEKDIELESPVYSKQKASDLILAYKIIRAEKQNDDMKPFVFNKVKLYPIVNSLVEREARLFFYFELYNGNESAIDNLISIKHIFKSSTVEKEFTQVFDIGEGGKKQQVIPLIGSLELNELGEGSYNYEINIVKNSETIKIKSGVITILNSKNKYRRIIAESFNQISEFDLHYNLAYQYYLKEEFDKAHKHILIALDYESESIKAKILLAELMLAEKKYDEAKEIVLPLVDKMGSSVYINFLMGKIYYMAGDLSRAIEYFKNGEKLGGATDYELLNFIANSYYKSGKVLDAIDYYRKSLAVNPGQAEIKKVLSYLSGEKIN